MIYDSEITYYTSDNMFGHQAPNATCVGCHSVHGANTYNGPLAAKILKRLPIQETYVDFMTGGGSADEIYDGTLSSWPMPPNDWQSWPDRMSQETAFCTGCHPYFTKASEDTVTVSYRWDGSAFSTETVSYKSHPMKRYWGEGDVEDPTGNGVMSPDFYAAGSTLPNDQEVAQMSTNGCQRCHGEEQYVNQGVGVWTSSFPHYTPSNARFLVGADETGGYQLLDVQNPAGDTTCYPCHRWNSGAEGAGATY